MGILEKCESYAITSLGHGATADQRAGCSLVDTPGRAHSGVDLADGDVQWARGGVVEAVGRDVWVLGSDEGYEGRGEDGGAEHGCGWLWV